jgi:LmbE family N-acetylglucosaminyl deacetylase
MKAMPVLGVAADHLFVYGFPVRKLSYHRQEVLEELVGLRRRIAPDLVFIPSEHDLHQDHQVVHAEGLRAFKDISVLGYELSWNHISFSAQAFVVLDKGHLERKWQALQCYRSQLGMGRLYMTRKYIEGIARVRGVQVKEEWAEAFEVLRLKW